MTAGAYAPHHSPTFTAGVRRPVGAAGGAGVHTTLGTARSAAIRPSRVALIAADVAAVLARTGPVGVDQLRVAVGATRAQVMTAVAQLVDDAVVDCWRSPVDGHLVIGPLDSAGLPPAPSPRPIVPVRHPLRLVS